MSYYLTLDFGSTYTKICAIDGAAKRLIGSARAFTTIHSDIREGYEKALKELEAQTGKIPYTERLACSSAGGGLKMIALGLVPELTAKAAALAAASAGAKVTGVYSYELNHREQEEIFQAQADIILLCGGTDGGNREVILHNARMIAEIEGNFSVIYAGNKAAADQASLILAKAGKDLRITANVMPVFNVLDTAPAKEAIRSLFIEKIIHAKGLSAIQKEMSAEVIPTPLAVLEAAELFSSRFGDLVAVDLGGATTDVYSICEGRPAMPQVIIKGLPEPYAKRSVEGDLGMRYNIDTLASSAAASAIRGPAGGLDPEDLAEWIRICKENPGIISKPRSRERRIDEFLARHAVGLAVERHCGTSSTMYTPLGEVTVINGKDLSQVPGVIGIGGALINADEPQWILSAAALDPTKLEFLKPAGPRYYLDRSYIFSAMGLLARRDPALALHIMEEEIKAIEEVV
ncbi:MAG: methylaspartate mutase accessory protein GlmL [Treponema sp.]|nr:methylaspartate mutase accessory protein GlmL [Treponema sp.]